eukprot:CAMPEP_0179191412 /NCGR_PEP_ID=MMETSP0796-20121207/95075_1 /TAXON_ID=73915 /ORGANISM="Pyrodinium bahamense, Strain pbaha01" /LENGTH=44 /DNA_ID= /DNA_START= /DNA_END= /DNA_ORIENTATION=
MAQVGNNRTLQSAAALWRQRTRTVAALLHAHWWLQRREAKMRGN